MQACAPKCCVAALGILAGLTLTSHADSGRAPTSPSLSALLPTTAGLLPPTATVSWECLRQSASKAATMEWSYQTVAPGCPAAVTAALVGGVGQPSGAPSNLRSTVTGSTVRLDWDGPPEPVSRFLIEAGSAATLSDLARVDTGSSVPSLIVHNVPDGAYYVRVRAIGSDGIPGPASAEIIVRVGACGAPPLAPADLTATVNGSQVFLSWTAPAGGDPPRSYVVVAGSAPALTDVGMFDTGAAATG